MRSTSNNLYQILGVDSNASSAELKSAYRELVKKHHPDAGGNQELILGINAAWEILGDPQKRLAYDLKSKQKDSFFQETTPAPSTQDFWEEATEEDLQSGEYESL